MFSVFLDHFSPYMLRYVKTGSLGGPGADQFHEYS